MIYLDNSATTKPYDEVIEYMDDIQRNHWGNPSSAHRLGIDAEKIIKSSSELVARELHTEKENIIFTSCGTEANNMALVQKFFNKDKFNEREIIISEIEHPAISRPCKYYEQQGVKVSKIPVDNKGLIDIEQLKSLITDRTATISVMYVNNEVGTIQPIKEISKIVGDLPESKSNNLVFHTDAVQAFGKIPIDLSSSELSKVDMLTISAHKIHGPKGMGALYARRPEKYKSFIIGGGQQAGLRSGTENVAGMAGFGLAASIHCENMNDKMKQVGKLRNLLMNGFKDSISDVRVNSPEDISVSGEAGKCVPHILSISFAGTKGEVILHSLEEKGIYVSTEAACSSKKHSGSPVLSAMGLNSDEMEGTLRFSLSEFSTEDEILYTIEETKKAVEKMRKLTKFRR